MFSLEIKGLNNLIKKVSSIENISIENVVREVAEDIEKSIKSEASTWAPKASQCISVFNMKKYGPLTCFAKVGLNETEAPFEEWKNLWFHQWGYHLYYFGNPTDKFITNHIMWFDNAVNNCANSAKAKLKAKIKAEIKKKV